MQTNKQSIDGLKIKYRKSLSVFFKVFRIMNETMSNSGKLLKIRIEILLWGF